MHSIEGLPNYRPAQDGYPMPLLDDGFRVDESIILNGSLAEIGARIHDFDVEIFEEANSKDVSHLQVLFHETKDAMAYEVPMVVDALFDTDNPEHVRGLLHVVLSARARQKNFLQKD